MDRGAWRATAHGVAKSQTGLRDWYFHFSDFSEFINHLGWSTDSDLAGLGWGLGLCISDKILGDAASASPGTAPRADSGGAETQAAGVSGASCLRCCAVLPPLTALTASIISLILKPKMHTCPRFPTARPMSVPPFCSPVSLTCVLSCLPPALALSQACSFPALAHSQACTVRDFLAFSSSEKMLPETACACNLPPFSSYPAASFFRACITTR